MKLTIKKLSVTTAAVLLLATSFAQSSTNYNKINVVTTAVPFLRISPDTRAAGMGELGIATSPDANSGFWNIGKAAFSTVKGSVGATYTPWFKDLGLTDVYLATVGGMFKLDDQSALSASIRYFSLGQITFTDALGTELQNFRPREFAIDAGYSRKLNDKLGIGVNLKYISSNLANGTINGTSYKTGSTIAGDIGLFHNGTQGFNWGVTLSNLGGKIAYTSDADKKDFIPANLGLGVTYTKKYDEENKLTFGMDVNKLLVPTPPAASDSLGIVNYRKKGIVGSWFSSLGDAPSGFGEEMKEFQLSVGAEYTYNNQFMFRAGYFFEDNTKGARKYFTLGAGVKYNTFGLNFAYLLPSGSGANRNPLSNTMRFSLLFDFDGGAEATK
jgi:Type IX secretion system protein PorV